MENAFNSIDRSAVRQGIRRTFPGGAPWIDLCYAEDSQVILGEEILTSGRGVQQGDPAGPAIFALAIHEDVEEAKEAAEQTYPGELESVGLFLDDTMAAGTARAVKAFLETLEERWKGKGLALVPSKSIVVPTGGHHTDLRPEDFPDMVWNEDGDFKLLGAPFGSKKECECQVAKGAAQVREAMWETRFRAADQSCLQMLQALELILHEKGCNLGRGFFDLWHLTHVSEFLKIKATLSADKGGAGSSGGNIGDALAIRNLRL